MTELINQSVSCPTLKHRRLSMHLDPLLLLMHVTHTFSRFAHPSNIFSLFSLAVFFFDHSSCHMMFQFLSFHHIGQRRLLGVYVFYLSCSDLVVSASCSTILFVFCAIQEILSITLGTTCLLPPVSFRAVLKLSRPCIHTSALQAGLLLLWGWRCIYLILQISFSGNSFLLLKAILDSKSVLFNPSLYIKVPMFELIPLPDFILVNEDVDL